jgi:hypothetical protein
MLHMSSCLDEALVGAFGESERRQCQKKSAPDEGRQRIKNVKCNGYDITAAQSISLY